MILGLLLAVLPRMSVPVEPDEPTARRWLERELAKPGYQTFDVPELDSDPTWSLPGGAWTLVALVVVLVLVGVLVYLGVPQLRRRAPAESGAVFDGTDSDATELRRRAGRLAEAGDWSAALREIFRALVRGLQERTLVDERPGLTADEAARAASRLLPSLGAELIAASVSFDTVVFGRRQADEAAYRSVADLEHRVRNARPVRDRADSVPGLAAPR